MEKQQLYGAIQFGSKLRKAGTGVNYNPVLEISTNPRGALAKIAANWNIITQAQQQTWNDAAFTFPTKNKFGDIYTPSGYQVFMKLNSNLALINKPIITTAPIAEFPILPVCTKRQDFTNESLLLNFEGGIGANISVLIYACSQVLRGSSFKKGKEKLLLAAPTNSTGVVDITYAYQNLFGVVKSNALIYLRLVAVSTITGQTSAEQILEINTGNITEAPKVGFLLDTIGPLFMPIGYDFIQPVRLYGFNLTDVAKLSIVCDIPGEHLISRNVDGPWMDYFEIGLNQLNQPRQNVIYLKSTVVNNVVTGGIIFIESTGALKLKVVFGGKPVSRSVGPTVPAFAFDPVYSAIGAVMPLELPYTGITQNITYSLSGINVDRFGLSLNPDGPWSDAVTVPVSINGTDAENKIYINCTAGAVGALEAVLAINGGDPGVIYYNIYADCIDGALTSPQSGGIAFGNAITGERADGSFTISGVGLGSHPVIFMMNQVNCIVEFSEQFGGVYSNPLLTTFAPPTVNNKTIWYQIVPQNFGPFSADMIVKSVGAPDMPITVTGTAV